jgi:hypothetical protein
MDPPAAERVQAMVKEWLTVKRQPTRVAPPGDRT